MAISLQRLVREFLVAAIVMAAVVSPDGPQAADPVSTTVPVETSRGTFDLVVYAPPAAPHPAPPAATPHPAPPAASASAAPSSGRRPVVLLISGEGGWKSFDILLSDWLSAEGYWVGGVDAKDYFSDPQDDRGLLAGDMRAYATALHRAAGRSAEDGVVLMGYSFGADLAPFIAGAPGWAGRVHGLVLVGPDEDGSLQYRITEMLGITYKSHSFQVADALKGSAGIATLFLHGGKDGWSAAPKLHAISAEPKKLVVIPGATHHFSGHEPELRKALRDGMNWLLGPHDAPAVPARGGR